MPQSAHHLASSVEAGNGVAHGVGYLCLGRDAQTAKSECHPRIPPESPQREVCLWEVPSWFGVG